MVLSLHLSYTFNLFLNTSCLEDLILHRIEEATPKPPPRIALLSLHTPRQKQIRWLCCWIWTSIFIGPNILWRGVLRWWATHQCTRIPNPTQNPPTIMMMIIIIYREKKKITIQKSNKLSLHTHIDYVKRTTIWIEPPAIDWYFWEKWRIELLVKV